jgi:hypothetical protein
MESGGYERGSHAEQVPPPDPRIGGMSANTFPATVYSSTVYSDTAFDPAARAKPSAADFQTTALFRDSLERDIPGSWSDNRLRQVEHFRSVPYIAIRAVMDLVGGSTFQLLRKRRKPKGKTTFGPGVVAKSTPQTQQQGRDEDYTPFEDYDHPLSGLMRRPNPNESMGEFAARIVLQNRLTGIGPVWKIGSKSNPAKPVQLWALRTPFMYPLYQVSDQYPHGAWRVNPYRTPGWAGILPVGLGAAGAVIPGEDVARFIDPHPIIDWDGWSPLTAGAVQLDVFDAVEESRKSAMDRGLSLDTVIVAPGMSPEAVNRLREGLEARHMGAAKSRRVAVLAPELGLADKFNVQTISATPRDMDYQQGWEQALKFVLALFGVPPIIAGLGEAGSYAAGYAARQQFYDRQEDYLGRLATWMDREFCDPWESYPDEFMVRIKPRPIDDKEMSEKKHARQCQVGTITYNESRMKDDLPPVAGGDMPVSVYVAKAQAEAMPQPDPMAAMGGGEGEEKPGEPGAGEKSGPPRPANRMGAGSLPPRAKAMGELAGSAGGFLVPPTMGRLRKRKGRKRGVRAVVARVLKSLEEGGE